VKVCGILRIHRCACNADIIRSRTDGTAQATDFSLSTWYRPQPVLEGCRVSWLQAVAEWRSFRVSTY
jgi:hypothetical protein